MGKLLAHLMICATLLLATGDAAWARDLINERDNYETHYQTPARYDPTEDLLTIQRCVAEHDNDCLLAVAARLSIDPQYHAVIAERLAETGRRDEAQRIFRRAAQALLLYSGDYQDYWDGASSYYHVRKYIDIALRQHRSGFESDSRQTLLLLQEWLIQVQEDWAFEGYLDEIEDRTYSDEVVEPIRDFTTLSEALLPRLQQLETSEFAIEDFYECWIISGQLGNNWFTLVDAQRRLGFDDDATNVLDHFREVDIPLAAMSHTLEMSGFYYDVYAVIAIYDDMGETDTARRMARELYDIFIQSEGCRPREFVEDIATDLPHLLTESQIQQYRNRPPDPPREPYDGPPPARRETPYFQHDCGERELFFAWRNIRNGEFDLAREVVLQLHPIIEADLRGEFLLERDEVCVSEAISSANNLIEIDRMLGREQEAHRLRLAIGEAILRHPRASMDRYLSHTETLVMEGHPDLARSMLVSYIDEVLAWDFAERFYLDVILLEELTELALLGASLDADPPQPIVIELYETTEEDLRIDPDAGWWRIRNGREYSDRPYVPAF